MKALRRLWKKITAPKAEYLKHPESPGVELLVIRNRFTRLYKPKHFATLSEVLATHRRIQRAKRLHRKRQWAKWHKKAKQSIARQTGMRDKYCLKDYYGDKRWEKKEA